MKLLIIPLRRESLIHTRAPISDYSDECAKSAHVHPRTLNVSPRDDSPTADFVVHEAERVAAAAENGATLAFTSVFFANK
jgi:hypothetical protein